jgi:hypothetical protein
MPREPPPHRFVGRAAMHSANLCSLIVAHASRAFGDNHADLNDRHDHAEARAPSFSADASRECSAATASPPG